MSILAIHSNHRSIRISALVTLLILLAILVPIATPVAHAATISVNTTADTTGGPNCTLRDAITAANTNVATGGCPAGDPGADTINFSVPGTILLTSALPNISQALTIDGTGQTITVSGNNTVRVLQVNSGVVFNLQNLTVASGRATGDVGGGIFNNGGTVNLTNVTFSSNSAMFGGAVYNYTGGSVTIANSSFTNNSATFGGAIASRAPLNISDTTFSGNQATVDLWGGGSGGAIYINGTGTATISSVTLTSNTAQDRGGGIHNDWNATLNLSNSTLSGNSATNNGGGVFNDSTATITNATFAGNSSASGGGIYAASPATVRNTIVANSTGGNCAGTAPTGNNNLASDATCGGTFTNSSAILLGTLGNYGGSTQTFPLLPGSSAIDAGDGGTCPPQDQRGVDRVGTCDVGAFESRKFTLGSLTGTPQSTAITTAFPTPLGLTVSNAFSEPVDGGQVSFTPPASGASASLSANTVTISSGTVSVNATANNVVGGPYNVVASTNGATSANFSLTNTKFVPTISTDIHDASHSIITAAPIASSVHDRAVVTGTVALGTPTGNITFKLYTNTTCTGTPTSETISLSGNNAESSTTSVPSTGMSYVATYNGDANYASVDATCEPLTANKLTPTVTTDIHNASHTVITSAFIGTSVHDSAVVTGTVGTPTGNVSFKLYANTTCTGTPTTETIALTSGSAESGTTTVPNTGMSYLATYNGDANYNSADGVCEPLTANKLTPTVTTDIHNASHTVITSAFIGTSVHDSAVVTGTVGTPTGNVTFKLYANTICTGTPTTETLALSSGSAESSATTVPSTGMSYLATYNGDANYLAADGVCEPLTANKLTPTVTTDIHNASHTVITSAFIGTSVHDSAVVTGTVGTPTGNVTFKLYANTTCTGTPTTETIALASGSAESGTTTVPNTGMSYLVSYAGDANYLAADGVCEPLTANKLTPTVTTDIHNASHAIITFAPIGSAVHDNATVSGTVGTPNGTVTFRRYSDTTCTNLVSTQSNVNLASGSAESNTTTVPSTGMSYLVSYNGDANYLAADGVCEPLTANKLTPTVTTNIHDTSHATITTSPIGSTVHDNASVTGDVAVGTPTGTITFTLYSDATCTNVASTQSGVALSGGSAESNTTTVPVGGLSYLVSYSGDSNYNSASGVCEPLSAGKATPTVTTDVHDASHAIITSAPISTTVHDRAVVSGNATAGTPTGNVTFTVYNNTTCNGTGTDAGTVALASGIAEPSNTASVGSSGLSFKARYNGDTNYLAADGACEPLPANKLTPTVTTDIHNASHTVITSAFIGTSVHDSVTVSGSGPTLSGNVTFKLYGNTTCTGTPSNQTVTLSGASAESNTTTVPNTGMSYLVSYAGDANYNAADGVCEPLTANKLTTTVNTDVLRFSDSSVVTTVPIGTLVHDRATAPIVSGIQPTGNITFTLYSSTTNCTGASTTQVVPLASGAGNAFSSPVNVASTGLSYLASYGGDDNFNPAVGTCEPLNVTKLTATINTDIHNATHTVITSATIGTSVHDQATVSGSLGTPTGTVTYTLYSDVTCTNVSATQANVSLVSGSAESSSTTLPSTGMSYLVSYSGDSTYNSAVGTCEPLKIIPTVTTSTHDASHGSIGSALIGSSTHASATVSSAGTTPTGNVTFTVYNNQTCSNGGTNAGTVNLAAGVADPSNTATMTSNGLSFRAHYNGDSLYDVADSTCVAISPIKLTPTVSTDIHNPSHAVVTFAPIGTSVHDSALVTGTVGTPTGTVTFQRYSDLACTSLVATQSGVNLTSGSAESSAMNVPVGGMSYLVTYSGDANYISANGPCEPLTATKATPTVSTDIHNASHAVVTTVPIGASVHDSASVTGNAQGGTPTGTVTFSWFNNLTCTAPTTDAGTIALNVSGIADPSSSVTTPASGLSFLAHYNGDANYLAADSACEPLSTTKYNPTITIAVHNASHVNITGVVAGSATAPFGSNAHGRAAVSGSYGTPTGNVTFTVYSNNTCGGTGTPAGTVALSSGVADGSNPSAITTSGLSFKAHYDGDAVYNPGDSGCAGLASNVYLPFIGKNITSPMPDLVIQSMTATTNTVQIVIRNQGNASVTTDFWVDLYINPNPTPTHVNQTWDMLSSQGAVWGYLGSTNPIAPSGVITLTLGDAYYWASLSNMPSTLGSGVQLFAQVDSAHVFSTYGNVLENHENSGGAYNNISNIQLASPIILKAPTGTRAPSNGKLPSRK